MPWATQAGSFSAEQTRRAVFACYARTSANNPGILSGGLISASDLQLSNAVSGLVVYMSTGEAIVPGNEGGAEGGFYARNTSQISLTLATANASLPRVDTLCLTVDDTGYTPPSGGTGGQVTAQAVTGTPTSGANITPGSGGYLSGVGTLPGSSLLLGYVLVPAAATNLTSADILNVATTVSLQGQDMTAHTNIATAETRTSTAYGTMPTPDQVTVVLPADGLIAVWYQATWQESVANAARAAIFVGSNQLKVATDATSTQSAQTEAAVINASVNTNYALATCPYGLMSLRSGGAYGGDVATGQVIGFAGDAASPNSLIIELGGVTNNLSNTNMASVGGPCEIFAAAGTYTISVMFKASSGSVTASNRRLWVKVLSFA